MIRKRLGHGVLLAALLAAALGAGSCGEAAAPSNSSTVATMAWKAAINAGNKDIERGGIPPVADGKLFIADGPRITALSAATGEHLWSTTIRQYVAPVTARIIAHNSQIFFADALYVFSLDANSGGVLW